MEFFVCYFWGGGGGWGGVEGNPNAEPKAVLMFSESPSLGRIGRGVSHSWVFWFWLLFKATKGYPKKGQPRCKHWARVFVD